MGLFDVMEDVRAPSDVVVVGADLSQLSISELTERAVALRAEAERIESLVEEKRRIAENAHAVFRL